MDMNSPVTEIAGIGPKKAEAFARLGVTDIRSLLYHLPRAYEHRGNIVALKDARDGMTAGVILTVAREPVSVTVRGHKTLTKVTAFDSARKAELTFFNQGYLKDVLHTGATYRFWGKISVTGGRISMTCPTVEPIRPGKKLPEFVPVYPLSAPLSTYQVRDAVQKALSACKVDDCDLLPGYIREKMGLMSLCEALHAVHMPRDYAMLEAGRKYFAFEELYLFACAASYTKGSDADLRAPRLKKPDFTPFFSALPFEFTGAQKRCARDIAADLTCGDKPMARLLSGDVGSGKTALAAFAAYIACTNGRQCALMAPTEVLASQHYKDLSELFSRLGFTCTLLTGSLGAKQKGQALADIASGRTDIIIGTHALISDGVEFSRLALVITDEQHRFGVQQRASLCRKGEGAHMLVMSATPIPRTLSLILYGDLASSRIDELPPGRQKVDTFVVDGGYRTRLDAFIKKNVDEGGRVYVVCPAVDSEENELVGLDYRPGEAGTHLTSVTECAAGLRERLPGLHIGTMYGKMKSADKERTMRDFASGALDVLVSTTVIEVGVNVPEATLMIVENAERFGLAQLHQLRGRVGRGEKKSYCVLVSDSKTEQARERLGALHEYSDGYKIAEIDLKMRGPGDFLPTAGGAKQHGELSFAVANLVSDSEMLREAFACARDTERRDPGLSLPENGELKKRLHAMYVRGAGSVS